MSSKKCPRCGFVMSALSVACRQCAMNSLQTNLFSCPSCHNAVSHSAGRCPHCGGKVYSPRKSTRNVILLCCVLGFGFLSFVGLLFAGSRQPSRALQHTSNSQVTRRSQQMEEMANSVSESQCDDLDRTLASPYHEATEYEQSIAGRCYLRKQRIRNRGEWEMAKDAFDKEEAARR